MLTNEYICEKFIFKQSCENRNMNSTSDKLYSYNLCIARWINDRIEVLDVKSSPTTNKHLNELKHGLWRYNVNWKYIKPKYVANAMAYNHEQFPNIDEEYQRVEKSFLKPYQIKEYIDNYKDIDENFFKGYSINKSLIDEDLINGDYHLTANYKHTSDLYSNPCNTLLNAEFKECEICSGLGFSLTKNMREKKCKHCSRGVLLCLKN